MVVGAPWQLASFEGAKRGCPDAGVKLLEVECADLEHKAHPALDKLTVRVSNLPRALLYSAGIFVKFWSVRAVGPQSARARIMVSPSLTLNPKTWSHHPHSAVLCLRLPVRLTSA